MHLVRRLECWVVGVLRWSQPLPEFARRKEPGGGTLILVRDLDLVSQGRPDSRRLEVVADGLPLFHGDTIGH